jgi:CDP-diacylglycerol--glycerol-3-phosphate 3-phosphatidyltransferase
MIICTRGRDDLEPAQYPDLAAHSGHTAGGAAVRVRGQEPSSTLAYPIAGLLFALAAITDSLDGYLARRLGQTTRLGAFLDPVADKLMVAVALVLIVSRDPRPIIVLTAAVIIGREIAISALREWMAGIGQRTAVAVSRIGKYKTILQMVGLTMLLFRADLFGLPIYRIGIWLTVIAAALTLISMALYLRAAWPHLSARS